MYKKIITVAVIVIVLIGGYFLLQGSKTQQLTNQQSSAVQESQNTPVESGNPQNQTEVGVKTEVKNTVHEIIYSDSGYVPKELKIKVGDTVTFKNESSGSMWTASAMHPSHIIYSGTSLQNHCPDTTNTSFDECKSAQAGESWSFTFNKAGTWGYHNHLKASQFGKIIVE